MDIEKYKPVIDDIIRKLRVPQNNREDASQECYLELLQKQKELESARDPLNYAATLCRNHILSLRRDQSVHTVEAESMADPRVFRKAVKLSATPMPDVSDEMMREAMKTLSEEELEVVSRLYAEGYSRMEVAAVLDIHPNTVDNRAKSGVAKLRKYFGER